VIFQDLTLPLLNCKESFTLSRGRQPGVEYIRQLFLDQIDSISDIFNIMLRYTQKSVKELSSGDIHPKQAERIISQSFLALVAASEVYFELVFIRYLAGAPYPNGNHPYLRAGKAESLRHAYEMFTGERDYDPEKKFLSF
jgi:hypothetical protein